MNTNMKQVHLQYQYNLPTLFSNAVISVEHSPLETTHMEKFHSTTYKMRMTTILLVSLVAMTLLITRCAGDSVDAAAVGQERQTIYQFFNYVKTLTYIKLDTQLEIMKALLEQLLNSIPSEVRGNSAVMLQDLIDESVRMRRTGNLKDKEDTLRRLPPLIAEIQTELQKQEPEDLILQRGLLGAFEYLARFAIEENKFNEKFVRGSKVLRAVVLPAGVEHNAELFRVLDNIESNSDLLVWEQLKTQFQEVKLRQYGVEE